MDSGSPLYVGGAQAQYISGICGYYGGLSYAIFYRPRESDGARHVPIRPSSVTNAQSSDACPPVNIPTIRRVMRFQASAGARDLPMPRAPPAGLDIASRKRVAKVPTCYFRKYSELRAIYATPTGFHVIAVRPCVSGGRLRTPEVQTRYLPETIKHHGDFCYS